MTTDWQNRTELLIGNENIKILESAHVAIAGLGGVGFSCCRNCFAVPVWVSCLWPITM